jgi:hypothetical protein
MMFSPFLSLYADGAAYKIRYVLLMVVMRILFKLLLDKKLRCDSVWWSDGKWIIKH